MRNAALYFAGLALGSANTVRHRRQGYTTPRPFDPANIDQTFDHALRIVDRFERYGIDWTGKRVLEIGPGSDLSTGAIMLARGAASYQAVDLFDNLSLTPDGLYDYLSERLHAPIDVSRLRFLQTKFPDLPGLDEQYDIMVSSTCFEHVAEPLDLLRRLRDLAAPRAVGLHYIDGKAHMRWFRDQDPLNILRYSDRVYRHILDFPGAPNRLRASDWLKVARSAGWSAEVTPELTFDPAGVAVARRWQGYSDLGVLTFMLRTI